MAMLGRPSGHLYLMSSSCTGWVAQAVRMWLVGGTLCMLLMFSPPLLAHRPCLHVTNISRSIYIPSAACTSSKVSVLLFQFEYFHEIHCSKVHFAEGLER